MTTSNQELFTQVQIGTSTTIIVFADSKARFCDHLLLTVQKSVRKLLPIRNDLSDVYRTVQRNINHQFVNIDRSIIRTDKFGYIALSLSHLSLT